MYQYKVCIVEILDMHCMYNGTIEPRHVISNMCDQQSLRSTCAYSQSDQSLCKSLEYSLTVKLLDEHHLKFLSLKGICTCSSESTHVKCHIVENHMSRLNYFRICSVCWQCEHWLALSSAIVGMFSADKLYIVSLSMC